MSKKIVVNLGYYLVGRRDGFIEPFFAQIIVDEDGDRSVLHNSGVDIVDEAIRNEGDEWWWNLMEVEHMPLNWDGYPPSIKELP